MKFVSKFALGMALGLPLFAGQATLPGTAPLEAQGDLAAQMVEGIHSFLQRETEAAAARRSQVWKRDYRSRADYERSIAPNRERLRKIIGAVDPRLEVKALVLEATTASPPVVARGPGYTVRAVRWPVFPGVDGEGLLIEPAGRPPVARVVAIPDADWPPETLAAVAVPSAPSAPPPAQFARKLAEMGCQVLVPVLIDRRDTWSGIPAIRMTNQPHREWIYRMAFEAGRHIIGYEVQKVLAAVDWFARLNGRQALPIVVAGYGEGGLLALYSAALDTRIESVLVSGYFQPREQLWKEPVYRDVWGLLPEFGDAELAGLVAPRALVVEAARSPEVSGPPPETKERRGATPNGALVTPTLDSVRGEVERARPFFEALKAAGKLQLIVSGDGFGPPGSDAALGALLASVNSPKSQVPSPKSQAAEPGTWDLGLGTAERQHRQFDQLVDFTQALLRQSPARRAEFWAQADASSPERWRASTRFYRNYIWQEVIGRLPDPSLPPNARTRPIYDEPKFRGYEVMLDVWPEVFAYGILLVPKDLQPGERRPVVVCQHGLEGRPSDLADPKANVPAYNLYGARLAGEGFIVYAPQNPYIGRDRFRLIQRKAHPLKLSLFSFILGQHQRTLEWLASLPFVDSARIGFYGISYGGKTAVRVPPLLEGYALSICSADFNEWVWKTTSVDSRYSYMLTGEYDMLEFDFANVVNYADLASLMAPRPFMVERGHNDGVAPDEWVAYEFAKVRRFYATRMGMPERAEIEFFNGPHAIHAEGTFEFLRRHLTNVYKKAEP
jgi:dienelactone hydrolase